MSGLLWEMNITCLFARYGSNHVCLTAFREFSCVPLLSVYSFRFPVGRMYPDRKKVNKAPGEDNSIQFISPHCMHHIGASSLT